MGHDLPRALWPDFAEEIAANAARPARPKPPAGRLAGRLRCG